MGTLLLVVAAIAVVLFLLKLFRKLVGLILFLVIASYLFSAAGHSNLLHNIGSALRPQTTVSASGTNRNNWELDVNRAQPMVLQSLTGVGLSNAVVVKPLARNGIGTSYSMIVEKNGKRHVVTVNLASNSNGVSKLLPLRNGITVNNVHGATNAVWGNVSVDGKPIVTKK